MELIIGFFLFLVLMVLILIFDKPIKTYGPYIPDDDVVIPTAISLDEIRAAKATLDADQEEQIAEGNEKITVFKFYEEDKNEKTKKKIRTKKLRRKNNRRSTRRD